MAKHNQPTFKQLQKLYAKIESAERYATEIDMPVLAAALDEQMQVVYTIATVVLEGDDWLEA